MVLPIQQIIFMIFAIMAVGAALMVVISNNPVHSALFLVLTFFAMAGIWILAQAEFLALILVLVYVGAVMTLFLFVVARFLSVACESLLMTLPNGPGHRLIEVSFGTIDGTLLIVSGLIMLIAWVMAEGLELVKEQSLTI